MTKNKRLITRPLLYLLIACIVVSSVYSARAAFLPSVERIVHNIVNMERDAVGLPPLFIEPRLINMALQHSEEMAILDCFSHTSPVPEYETMEDRAAQANIKGWSSLAENIGRCFGVFSGNLELAQFMMDGWIGSAGHRANILNEAFTHIGIGVFEKDGWYYFTQNFASFFPTAPPCEGDFSCDNDVDGSDLAVFAGDFGRKDCLNGPLCGGDFDGNGDVDGSDLALFAADFGRKDCIEE